MKQDIIPAYLHYLQDMSRKLIMRTGMEHVLKGTKKTPIFFNNYPLIGANNQIQNYLDQVNKNLESDNSRRLFLGLGLVFGSVRKNKRKRGIAAPLAYALTNTIPSEEGSNHQTALSVDWESIIFNYDLATLLLDQDEPEDEDGDDLSKGLFPDSSEQSYRVFEEIEEEFEKYSTGNEPEKYFLYASFCINLLHKIQRNLSPFQGIKLVDSNFDYDKQPRLNEGVLHCYQQNFLFVRNVPHQLSTHEAIHHLIKQAHGFENPLLSNLFESTLRNQSVNFKDDLYSDSELDEVLQKIPFSLSENQKDSLRNAWKNEISYIQGPPGTGKSHTIAAIMLSALLMGRRVLLVSNKNAAIKVVQTKIDNMIGRHTIVNVGDEKQSIDSLRAFIDDIIQNSAKLDAKKRLINQRKELEQKDDELSSIAIEIHQLENKVRNGWVKQNEFYNASIEYLDLRKSFKDNKYDIPALRSIPLSGFEYAETILPHLDSVIEETNENRQIKRRNLLFLLRTFALLVREFGASPRQIRSKGLIYEYLKELIKLQRGYTRFEKTQDTVPPNVAQLESNLSHLKKEYNKKLCLFLVELQKERRLSTLLKLRAEKQIRHIATFKNILFHRNNPQIVSELMRQLDKEDGFSSVISVLPLWASEIRNLGMFLPFRDTLFDLVIVDEASQVNIAEVLPAFYRGSRICVVGDKAQLGLSAAGLSFLNTKYEEMSWNRWFKNTRDTIGYVVAKKKDLLVSQSSILDFITSESKVGNAIPKAMLDEHFRSMPGLAHFTSKHFYDGKLKIMTEVSANIHHPNFRAISVTGSRAKEARLIFAEVEQTISLLKEIVKKKIYCTDNELLKHGFDKKIPSIGVLSFLTDQRTEIRARVEDEFAEDEIKAHDLFVATPEEFQGNERDIMIITPGLDGNERRVNHFNDPNRFNVATSRAKYFTFIIYTGIPQAALLFNKYFKHFGVKTKNQELNNNDTEELPHRLHSWKYSADKIDSEFERRVEEYLRLYIDEHGGNAEFALFNQVPSCGYKLDFVLYRISNGCTVAVEVDGKYHFNDGEGKSSIAPTYSEEHKIRIETLSRARWKIINVPYYDWYKNGWLCDRNDPRFQLTKKKMFDDISLDLECN